MKWALVPLVLGCALRFYLAYDSGELRDDEKYRYLEIASNLRDGHGFAIRGHPTAQAMPLWPAALALWPLKAHYLNALLSTLALPLAWLLARRLAGPRVAFVVLCLMAVDLDQAALGGSALTEPLLTVLLLLFALAWAHGRTLPAAIALGLAVLTRPEVFLLPFALAIFRREWKRPAILLAAVVIAITPWAIRNAVTLRAFVPFTTMGGVTLRAGMNPEEEKLPFRKRGQSRGMKFRSGVELAETGTEVAYSREMTGDALRYARENPGSALTLTAAKAMLLWTPVQRKGTSAVYALAILAAWWALIKRVRFRPALVGPLLCVMTLVGLTFIAIPRYRAPYHAYVFLLAAGGVVRERAAAGALSPVRR
ncbi:MAG: hypothetical protein ACYTF8_07580 [Planctomycetota bacterium]